MNDQCWVIHFVLVGADRGFNAMDKPRYNVLMPVYSLRLQGDWVACD